MRESRQNSEIDSIHFDNVTNIDKRIVLVHVDALQADSLVSRDMVFFLFYICGKVLEYFIAEHTNNHTTHIKI
jgi:hypothetical protein